MSYGSYSFKDIPLWYHISSWSRRYQNKELKNQIYLCLAPNYWFDFQNCKKPIDGKNKVTPDFDHFNYMKWEIWITIVI